MSTGTTAPSFPALLQDFFCQRLVAQRNASARTVASYRDAFRLLLRFAASRRHRPPDCLAMSDLDAPLIAAFLDHLEATRGNGIRTRNARLAAIRSFLRYASFRDPASLQTIHRVLAIPMKRYDRPLLGFLARAETEAILSAPDPCTWSGLRDHAMLATLYNTGARVSEVAALRVGDATLGREASLRIHGKGRKERLVPLWKSTAATLRGWIAHAGVGTDAPLFPNRYGAPLTRAGIESRLCCAVGIATKRCPSLAGRRISPHTLRHTTAMHLLQSGVDLSVIALWLGHESPSTTHLYVEADLTMKERALAKLAGPPGTRHRFHATEGLLRFLDGL
jgi:integrase/recombinase XerD